jgi:hypothetical protein
VRWADFQELQEANGILERIVETQRQTIADMQQVISMQAASIRANTEVMKNAIALMQKPEARK